jgi:hypothetical protein
VFGWVPRLIHGPIHEKFDVFYIKGVVAVWAWYTARCAIGFLVGITRWPERWWLRGPLCGAIMIGPLCFVSLAVPTCGPVCAASNLSTAIAVGATVAGIAFALTGRHRW